MTALPAATDFTGASVTEGQYKTAMTNLRAFLADLFGASGTKGTAISTLMAKGAAVASAGSLAPGTDGLWFHVTGNTTITGIAAGSVSPCILVFDGTPQLTHNGTSFILPTGANITAAAGDVAMFAEESAGNWRCLQYTRASGAPLTNTGITLSTKQASTSGQAIDFNGLPAGIKRITVNFEGVSTNGASNWLIQIGDSGGIETSGYLGSGAGFDAGSSFAHSNFTTGFGLRIGAATVIAHGSIVLTLVDAATNTWCAFGIVGNSAAAQTYTTGGSKSLSATLDRVRITTVGGTDAFDAGNINITYE